MSRMPKIEHIKVYNLVMRLSKTGLSRKDIVYYIGLDYGVPCSTAYQWLSKKNHPFGNKNRLISCKELFYVIGALLGDGCYYYWEKGRVFHVNLVGDYAFTRKYADKLSVCLGKPVKNHKRGGRNYWFVTKTNIWLFMLFKRVRENPDIIYALINNGNRKENALEFIAGFFDAEGCVKIIKEPCRKTPKICLDITNTKLGLLEPVRIFLEEFLDIKARYSIQKAHLGSDNSHRKRVYHLRIYKKSFVEQFFFHIHTTKLSSEKIKYVKNWLGPDQLPIASL